MWFGRTWWGRAGPKVISRAVTSETHFPTIKERERNYQDQTSPVSTALSQTFACVCRCVCVLYLPATITPRHTRIRTLLSHHKTVTEHFQMCFTYNENRSTPEYDTRPDEEAEWHNEPGDRWMSREERYYLCTLVLQPVQNTLAKPCWNSFPPCVFVCACLCVCISELRLLSRSVSMLAGHQTQ